jgi:hypothetical protein
MSPSKSARAVVLFRFGSLCQRGWILTQNQRSCEYPRWIPRYRFTSLVRGCDSSRFITAATTRSHRERPNSNRCTTVSPTCMDRSTRKRRRVAMQPRLHRLLPDVQHCCNFGHTQLLDVSQDEKPCANAEAIDRQHAEDLAKLPDTCLPLGVQGGLEAYSMPLAFVVLAQ